MITLREITQTRFGRHQGNCFAACIASIFPVELEEVPDFWARSGALWFDDFERWMADRFRIEPSMSGRDSRIQTPGQPYLMGGSSARGLMHSVVGLDGVMVWDPHPSRAGLLEILDYTWFYPLEG